MTCDFSGLVGKKVTDKAGDSGTVLGAYLRHDGIFLLIYGGFETCIVFILQGEKDGNIFEIESERFYENFRVT